MKAAIAERRKDMRATLTVLRRDLKKAEKEKDHDDTLRIDGEIVRLERLVKFYTPHVYPVGFQNSFVMNGKLLEQFIKKLPKGFHLTASFTDDAKLEICHKNGKITLYDLSEHYPGLKLPKGEVFLDGLGIDFIHPR